MQLLTLPLATFLELLALCFLVRLGPLSTEFCFGTKV